MSVIIAYPTEKVFPQIYKFSVRRKSIFPSGREFAGVKWCGFVPVVRPCSANTQKVIACHCEERSDGTIRFSVQYNKIENNTLGKYVRRNEFA